MAACRVSSTRRRSSAHRGRKALANPARETPTPVAATPSLPALLPLLSEFLLPTVFPPQERAPSFARFPQKKRVALSTSLWDYNQHVLFLHKRNSLKDS